MVGSSGRGPSSLLLERAGFGLSPAQITEARGHTDAGWVAAQLAPTSVAEADLRLLTAALPVLNLSTKDFSLQSQAANRGGNWDQMQAISYLSMGRALWSRRQLFERMVDFWSNHLNVTCPSDEVWALRADYDRNVIRAHALGSFRDLLRAAIRHPAMLRYLNNNTSTRSEPNENLGRELLELHTVGVGAGYTEADVLDSARILTGMTCELATYGYVYRTDWHWTGAVRVLGFEHPNASSDGQAVVGAYLDHLARHPATATRLATRLCAYFVSDTPPTALVKRMAAVYADADTAIAPVLREMFLASEFAHSAGTKVRRPAEQLIAAVRTLGLRPGPMPVVGIQHLYEVARVMANEPYAWPTPDGYPTAAEEWSSAGATLTRMNAVMALAQGAWKGFTQPPLSSLVPKPLPRTHGSLVAALYQRLHFRKMSGADLNAVCAFLGVKWSTPLTVKSPVLNTGRDLPRLVGVLLNAPALAVH